MSTDTTHDDHAVTPPEPSMPEHVPTPRSRRRRLIVVAAFIVVAAASVSTGVLWFAQEADGYRIESTGVDAWGGPTITAGGSTELCLPNRPDQLAFMQFGLRNPGKRRVTVTAVGIGLGIEAAVVVEWNDNGSTHDFPMTLGPGETRQILVTVRRNAAHQPALQDGQLYGHYYTDGADVAFRVLGTDHRQSVPFRGPGGFWLGVDDANPPAMACTGHITGR